jgi:hypothetical protein
MTQEEVYKIWAPEACVWSRWVSPVLFAQFYCSDGEELGDVPELPWASWLNESSALVVDLPGDESVRVGVSFVSKRLWPIPAYNASPGPEMITLFGGSPRPEDPTRLNLTSTVDFKSTTVVNMRGIVRAICGATSMLRSVPVTKQFRPAFLLDSLRLPRDEPLPGMFDNRWITIPQDYPSAEFLKGEGIRRVMLVQRGRLEPMEDLAHVLLRWQEKGIEIFAIDLENSEAPRKIEVRRPRGFRASWYRVLARLGLRRSSAGGFGSHVPEPSGGGG